MKRPSITRLFELQRLLVNFRGIKRVVHVPGPEHEWENDVDHSYSLAILMIYLNEGYTWKSKKITLAMLHAKKKDTTAVSPEIKVYYDALYALLKKSPHLFRHA